MLFKPNKNLDSIKNELMLKHHTIVNAAKAMNIHQATLYKVLQGSEYNANAHSKIAAHLDYTWEEYSELLNDVYEDNSYWQVNKNERK